MEETLRVGRKIVVSSGLGDSNKNRCSSTPTYTMSYFKLPIALCHEIEALIKKFFWGQRGEGRKVHCQMRGPMQTKVTRWNGF